MPAGGNEEQTREQKRMWVKMYMDDQMKRKKYRTREVLERIKYRRSVEEISSGCYK